MKHFLIIISFIGFLAALIVAPVRLPAKNMLQASGALSAQQQAAREVHDLLFQRDYEKAQIRIAQFIQKWPEDIMGYFGMMILYQIRNFENFDHRFDEEYLRWHESGRQKAIAIVDDPEADAWHLFLAGGALAVSGLYRLNQDETFGALRDGFTAINALKDALKKEPQWADPLYGLGMYDYWRSVFTNRWTFLPFFPDRRQKGIEYVKKALGEGTFVRDLAAGSLAYIDYNEEKYEKALGMTQKLLKTYPENIILHLLQGHILTKMKRYEDALDEYSWVVAEDSHMTKAYYYIARMHFDKAEALKKEALEQQKPKTKEPVVISEFEKVLPWAERYVSAETKASKRWKAMAYSLWGESLYQLQRWEEAKAKFKLALKNDYSLYLPKERLRIINKK